MSEVGLREAQALERAIGRARWGGALLAFLVGPFFPHLSLPGVLALGVGIVAYNLVVLRASRTARSRGEHDRVTRLAFAGDLVALSYAMFLFSVDPFWTTWVIGTLVITGAAFRFGTEGTVASTLALVAAYAAILVFRATVLGYPFRPERVAFDLSVYLLTAVMVDRILRDVAAVRAERETLIARLERRVVEDGALSEVGRIVGSSRGAAEVVPAVLQAGRSVFRFDRATLFTIDEEKGEYRAIHRLTEGAATAAPTFRIGEGLIALALQRDAPLLVRDVLSDPHYVPRHTQERRRSVIVVPLKVAGRQVAALSLSRGLPDAFTPDDVRLAEIVASYVAQVLENERLFAEASQAQALRALDRLKDEFLATVSHELRTPLTIIGGTLELIRRGVPRSDELADQALRNVHRLTRSVQDLLDLAQLQEARVTLEPEYVACRGLLDDVARAHEFMVAERGQRIVVEAQAPLPFAYVDRARMVQVLGNLVENAIRYSPLNSPITLRAARTDGELRLSVTDRGPGVPANERERIFDKFYRGVRTRDLVSGTGLGLAIAKSLVDLHQGRVWVEDASPGSVFIVALPLEPAAVPA